MLFRATVATVLSLGVMAACAFTAYAEISVYFHDGSNVDNVWHGTDVREKYLANGGNDVVYAYGGADDIRPGAGLDVVHAGAGKDAIYMTNGLYTYDASNSDLVVGGPGDDWISGGNGDDTMRGGDGNDTIGDCLYSFPHLGADTIEGGPGDDVIYATETRCGGYPATDTVSTRTGSNDNAVDTISCGTGNDTVLARTNDIIAADCETVIVAV